MPGQLSFLILLEADPLKNVTRIKQRVGGVVRGQWYPESELQSRLNVLADKWAKLKRKSLCRIA